MSLRRIGCRVGAIILGLGLALSLFASSAQAQTPTPTPVSGAPPPLPQTFAGDVMVQGGSIPDGTTLVARIGEDYESELSFVQDGRYFLKVTPPSGAFSGRTIRFFLGGEIEADQTVAFVTGTVDIRFNLTFAKLPTFTPTPLPFVLAPSIYSGAVVVAGSPVPEGSVLIARVGAYESFPGIITGNVYSGLVIAPSDEGLVGQPIEFFLNGHPSTPPSQGVFLPGTFNEVNLVFIGVPLPDPTETATPEPPTETPVPPTPTETPEPPPTSTATPKPTRTRVPATSTSTPVPPTPRPIIVTATRPPAGPSPTATPTSGGGCRAEEGPLPFATAAGNLLLVLAPLGVIGGLKLDHRRRRRR